MAITTYTVTSEKGTSSSDLTGLDNVIQAINVGGSQSRPYTQYTINIAGLIRLTSALPALNLRFGSSANFNLNVALAPFSGVVFDISSAGNTAIGMLSGA